MPNIFLETLRVLAKPLFGRGLWGKPVFRSIAAWYRRAYRPEFVMVGGNRLYLNHEDEMINSYLAVHRYWEPTEEALMRRYVRPGMNVLDLGANIGYHTLSMASMVGPNGRVTAFEPDATNFGWLT
jgi:protein-L-isoaspartate O-methyltransferase